MTFSIETLSYADVAKTIDHSLLKPELDDAFVEAGCRLALEYDVASVCVRPADVRRLVAEAPFTWIVTSPPPFFMYVANAAFVASGHSSPS